MKASNKNRNAKRGVKRVFPATKDAEVGIEDPLLNDARFRDATWDPKFSKVPKRAKGAIEDERFVSKLKNDSSFRQKFTPVDRFGRPRQQAKLDLSLKRLAPSDDDDDNNNNEDGDGDDGDDDEIRPNVMQKFKGMDDKDDEDEDDDDMSDMEDYIEDANEELEHIPRGNATKRLAVIGLDWAVTRAVDILASLGSFCPTGKRIQSVEVHPSKFGLERLAAEAKFGPQVIAKEDLRVVREEKNKSKIKQIQAENNNDDLLSDDEHENDEQHESDNRDDDDDVDENDVKSWKQQAALRRYEEERLKYYYGVVEFEDVKSADAVYEQCDGVEYAQSGRAFDLRFIPDEMAIETTPRERAHSVPDGYKPPNVNLSSLNNSTVKLSWDADPPDRVVLKKKAFGKNDMMEADLKAYLASSSEDEVDSENDDNDGEEKGNTRKKMSQDDIQKRRNLLLGIDDGKNKKSDAADDDLDLEVTFEPGMLEKAEEILKRKQDKEELKNETEWETRLRRIRERKNDKRKQRRELMASKDNPGDNGDDEVGDDFSEEEGDEDDDYDNPTFSDPFFSVERDFDQEEKKSVAKAKAKEAETNKSTKRKAKGKGLSNDDDADDHDDDHDGDEQRRQAQLELLAMDIGLKKNNDKLKQTLAAADSDEEEEKRRNGKRGKRTRGKRRSQKADIGEDGHRVEKPSVVDMDDKRFQNVFNSHLFAIDPTHPKYKENDTTRNIIKEKGRRSHNRAPASVSLTSVGKNATEPSRGQTGAQTSENAEPQNSAQAELNRLAARVKARANAKRKAQ